MTKNEVLCRIGLFLLLGSYLFCHGFLIRAPSTTTLSCSRAAAMATTSKSHRSLSMARKDDGSDDNDASSSSPMNNDNNDTLVTKEMFLRELLADPVVKRKKGAGNKRSSSEYKVLDNRDSLPFRVENQVPDPYTSKEAKRKNANKVRKPPSSVEEGLKSSLYTNDFENQDTRTMLGEFILDKHTTTGDILEIGDVQYKVIRHKCQYKYAGGKRFVMVRKILQVKEIGRLQTEEYLKRQWKQSSSQQDGGDSSNISLS